MHALGQKRGFLSSISSVTMRNFSECLPADHAKCTDSKSQRNPLIIQANYHLLVITIWVIVAATTICMLIVFVLIIKSVSTSLE